MILGEVLSPWQSCSSTYTLQLGQKHPSGFPHRFHLPTQDWFLQRVQTYLHLSGFILFQHKAENISVRPSEQTKVERTVSNGEFLEEHCKQRMKGWALISHEDRMGPELGNVQVGQITGNSHGSSNGRGPDKAVVTQSLPFIPASQEALPPFPHDNV